MMEGMDRIPIGKHPQPDNVVQLPVADEAPERLDDEMSYEEAIAADAAGGAEDAAPAEPLPASQVIELVEQAARVAAGMFAAGASALAEAIRSTLPHEDEQSSQADPAAKLAGAALSAAVTSAEAAAAAAKQVAETIGPALTWLGEPAFVKDASEMAAGAARVFDGRWKASQAEMAEAAASFLGALVPATMRGVGSQIDLTALLREHVDIDVILDDLAERVARKIADRDGSAGQT